MIGSKSVDFSISTWLQGRLTIELISQSIPNNQSVYKAKLYISRKNSETFYYANTTASLYMTISGPGYSSSTKNRTYAWNISSTWILIREETITVTHNANGTPPSSTFYGAITDSYQGWNGNASLTYTFPTIPRYTTVTNPSISSITRNSYTFSFSTGNTIDRWEYSSNGGAWTLGQDGDRTSATKTLSGFGANTKPTIKVRVKRKDSQLWTESSVVTVTLEATASPNTPTFSSITRNSFTINVGANKSFNGFQYSLDDGTSWSAKVSGSSVSITGRSANTLYNVRVKVYDGVHTGTLSGASARGQVTTMAIASPNTPTLSSKTGIQIVVNWASTNTVINVQYRLNNGSWVSTGANFSARSSGSFTITGLSPNTTYAIGIRVLDAVHTSSWSGASANLSQATYRLSTVTGANFNLGSGVTATVTEYISNMFHDIYLEAYYGGVWNAVTSSLNQSLGATLTPNSTQITALENANPTSNSITMRFRVVNRWNSSGTIQGTTYSANFTATIINANPTLSGFTYKDVHSNADFVAWKGGNQYILRNVSQLQITLGTANAIKGAKLSKYVLTVAGKSFTVNATSGATTQTGATINAGVINAGTNQTATVEVFDTRGNKVARTLTIQMIDWAEPQIIHGTGERLNSYEQPTYLNLLARYSRVLVGGTDVNELTAQYRIKVKGSADSTYGAFVDIIAPNGSVNGIWQEVSSSQFMQNLDENTTYTMHIRYKDPVVAFIDYYVDIEKGVGLMEFFEDKVELGVPLYDKSSTKKYLLEGEGGTDLVTVLKAVYPVGAIYTSVTSTNPSSIFGFGTWVAFGAGRTLVGVNTSDTDFNTVEKTGGSKTNTLAIANLPAHTHTFTGNATGSSGAHSHTITVNSGGAHTHTVTGTVASGGAHTHTVSGTAASAGAHTHKQDIKTWMGAGPAILPSGNYYLGNNGVAANQGTTESAGAHTHTVSGTAASAGAHSHTFSSGSAASAGAHTHTASSNSTGAHTHTVSGSNSNTGSGTAFNTMDPYITVYMWKRTA